MPLPQTVLDWMHHLDTKYGGDWGSLPHDHPDIQTLQQLNPEATRHDEKIVWKEQQIDFLKRSYMDLSDREIAEVLNMDIKQVNNKRTQLRLFKNKAKISGTRRICQLDRAGNIITVYDSALLAAIAIDASPSSISTAGREHRRTVKGFYWCYEDMMGERVNDK